MSTRAIFGSMIVGSVAVMFLAAARHREPPAAPPAAPRAHERPWLTPEAAAQIVGPGGSLGPLFAGVTLGGPAPTQAVRAHVVDFARANGVDIRFEIVAGELAAIRFAVTFGGCCGYEGADTLARQLGRPRTESCCGCTPDWVDDWALALDDGTHVRARVRVNRVEVRWEETATFAELVDRAEHLLGEDRASVRASAGDRWTELDVEHRYLLEVPYPFARQSYDVPAVKLADRNDLGLQLVVEHGRIAEVSIALEHVEEAEATLRARWGRPRIVSKAPDVWSWRRPDRSITADFESYPPTLVIRRS